MFRSSGIAKVEALGRTRHEITEGTSARADAARPPGDCNATRRRFGSNFGRQAYVLITQRDDAGAIPCRSRPGEHVSSKGPRVLRRHQCAYEQSDKARWVVLQFMGGIGVAKCASAWREGCLQEKDLRVTAAQSLDLPKVARAIPTSGEEEG